MRKAIRFTKNGGDGSDGSDGGDGQVMQKSRGEGEKMSDGAAMLVWRWEDGRNERKELFFVSTSFVDEASHQKKLRVSSPFFRHIRGLAFFFGSFFSAWRFRTCDGVTSPSFVPSEYASSYRCKTT